MNIGLEMNGQRECNDELFQRRLSALAVRHGVERSDIHLLGEGATAFIFGLDADRVVRLPRGPDGVPSLRREVAMLEEIAPLQLSAPQLLLVDDPPTVTDVPYAVLTRQQGVTLDDVKAEEEASIPVLRAVVRELARLHSAVRSDALPAVRDLRGDDNGFRRIAQLVEVGLLTVPQGRWAERTLAALAGDGSAFSTASLLHGDVRPTNVMVSEDSMGARTFASLIDWGDAAIGPPVLDFGCLPPKLLPAALDIYREFLPDTNVSEAAILRVHLGWALASLARDPRAHETNWSAPPAGRLLEIIRLASSASAGWSQALSLV